MKSIKRRVLVCALVLIITLSIMTTPSLAANLEDTAFRTSLFNSPETKQVVTNLEARGETSESLTSEANESQLLPLETTEVIQPAEGDLEQATPALIEASQQLRIKGIDVSFFQKNITWPSVHDAGKIFAWCKASESRSKTPSFDNNIIESRNAGLFSGAYHLGWPDANGTEAHAIAEANYFVTIASPPGIGSGYLRPMLDIEADKLSLTMPNLARWILAWVNRVNELKPGSNPLLYCRGGELQAMRNLPDPTGQAIRNLSMWLMHYNGQNPYAGGPQPTPDYDWSAWTIWQYGIGTCAGAANSLGFVDLNVFQGNEAAFPSLIMPGGASKITITAPAGSGEELLAGKSYQIRWIPYGLSSSGHIELQYRIANGPYQTIPGAANLPIGQTSFSWTVPTSKSNTCTLFIGYKNGSDFIASDAHQFRIRPHPAVADPTPPAEWLTNTQGIYDRYHACYYAWIYARKPVSDIYQPAFGHFETTPHKLPNYNDSAHFASNCIGGEDIGASGASNISNPALVPRPGGGLSLGYSSRVEETKKDDNAPVVSFGFLSPSLNSTDSLIIADSLIMNLLGDGEAKLPYHLAVATEPCSTPGSISAVVQSLENARKPYQQGGIKFQPGDLIHITWNNPTKSEQVLFYLGSYNNQALQKAFPKGHGIASHMGNPDVGSSWRTDLCDLEDYLSSISADNGWRPLRVRFIHILDGSADARDYDISYPGPGKVPTGWPDTNTFKPNDQVKTSSDNSIIRNGPGISIKSRCPIKRNGVTVGSCGDYLQIGLLSAGTKGTIVSGPASLDGKNLWWKVAFNSGVNKPQITGWVAQFRLIALTLAEDVKSLKQEATQQEEQTSLDATGALEGYVRDLDNNPLDESVAGIIPTGTSDLIWFLTGPDGFYHIDGLPPGHHAAGATSLGFQTQTDWVDISSGLTTTRNWNLALGVGSLGGYITSGGQPLEGVLVTTPALTSDLTGPDGQFHIDGVQAGSQQVTVGCAGYYLQTQTVSIVATQTLTVNWSLNPSTGTLQGYTRDASHAPISGACVMTGDEISTYSGPDGFYSISPIEAGARQVYCLANNYNMITATTVIQVGQTTNLDWTISVLPIVQTGQATNPANSSVTLNGGINPNGLAAQVWFEYGTSMEGYQASASQSIPAGTTTVPVSLALTGLLPGTTYYFRLVAQSVNGTNYGDDQSFLTTIAPGLYGKVINVLNGQGIGGAAVTCGSFTTTSTADGSWSFLGIPSGTYNLSASRTGYLSRTIERLPVNGAEEQAVTQNIALTPNGTSVQSLYGTIVNAANGNGLNGARVELADGLIGYSYSYNINGQIQIANVPADVPYTLTATGFPGFWPRSLGGVKAAEFITLAMSPEAGADGTLSGRITSQTSGAGVSGARVEVGMGLIASSDASGYYTLDHLPAGDYYVQAWRSGYECETGQVIVGSGTTTQNYALKPNAAAGWVYGQVESTAGSALNGALVTIGGKTVVTRSQWRAWSTYPGYYTVWGVAPGNRTLTASMDGYYNRSCPVAVPNGAGVDGSIALTAEGAQYVTLSGVVKNVVGSAPLAGARVSPCAGIWALSDGSGAYTIDHLPIGPYNLSASRADYYSRTIERLPVSDSSGPVMTQNIALTPAGTSVQTLYGTIVNAANGNGLNGARVELADGLIAYSYDGNWPYRDGYFQIADVPADVPYTLTATGFPGFWPRSLGGVKAAEFITLAMSPEAGADGSLSGRITSQTSGAGVSGARVEVGMGLIASSDASGYYTLDHLPAGDYYVQAWRSGYECETGQATIGSGITTQNYALKPNAAAGGVYGQVMSTAGSALNGALVTIGGKTVIARTTWQNYSQYSPTPGYYTVWGVSPGNQPVVATLYGYNTFTSTVMVPNANGIAFNITLITGSQTYPTVSTGIPSGVTQTSASLSGIINPNGLATTAWFEWSLTPSAFSSRTPSQSIGSGTDYIHISANLTSLTPSTPYYVRAVAMNSAGTTYGEVRPFTTLGSAGNPPLVSTGAATGIGQSSATLNGSVNPRGTASSGWFQWGATTGYGSATPSQSLGSSTATVAISAALSGLTPGTLYHYRLIAQNSWGVAIGADQTFTTLSSGGVTVWPGDADNSGSVNGLDFTKIFLYWGKSGQGRTNPSNQWRAESCPNISPPWNPTEALYADCNGDGIINGLDFTVVFLNWSKTHTLAQGGNWNPSDLQLPVLPGTSIGLETAKEQDPDAGLVTYALWVSPLEDLNSVYAVLRFDPKRLALDSSFGQGGILPCGFFSAAQVMAKNEPGRIELAAGLPGTGASGGGELLLFRFRLLQPSLSKNSLSAPTLEGSPVFTFTDGRQQRLESSW